MKDQIRRIVLSHGADLCGIANIERFHDAPLGYNPKDVFYDCKSVISYAIVLPRGLTRINPRLVYAHYNDISCPEVDMIGFKAAKEIEDKFGCLAVPMPCDTPYEYWEEEKMEGKGLLSMKHMAVQAGLGSIGKSTLFLNKHFGNMLTLGAILTNLDLLSDELSEDICIDNCNRCMVECPVQAIEDKKVNQQLCRRHTYGKTARGFATVDCNICRVVCPLNNRM